MLNTSFQLVNLSWSKALTARSRSSLMTLSHYWIMTLHIQRLRFHYVRLPSVEKTCSSAASIVTLIQCVLVPSQWRRIVGQTVRTTWAQTPSWRRCSSKETRPSSTQRPRRTSLNVRAPLMPASMTRTVQDIITQPSHPAYVTQKTVEMRPGGSVGSTGFESNLWLFSAVFKLYCQIKARKGQNDIDNLKKGYFMSTPPEFITFPSSCYGFSLKINIDLF